MAVLLARLMLSSTSKNLRGIIFDFDGVIVESVEVKAEAFRRLFLDYPRHLDEIMRYHMANGGIGRFVKFKTIYKDILKKELTEEHSRYLGERFTQLAYEGVVHSSFVNGAFEFIKKYYRRIGLFVISGTPEDELVDIIRERKLDRYFKGIYGTPRTKGDLAKQILRAEHYKPSEIIFVGDSINDYHGARQSGIRFIGRVHEKYESPFKTLKSVDVIKDLNDLEGLLKKQSLL